MILIGLAVAWVLCGLMAYGLAVEAERAAIGAVPSGSWGLFFACLFGGPFCFYVGWAAWKMYREPRRSLDLGPQPDDEEER